MVSRDGKLTISDFTCARVSSYPEQPYTPEDPKERDRSGRESKRIWYKAPELLFRAKQYTCKSDMFALGLLFSEIATSTPLFNSSSEIDHLLKIFNFLGSPDR
jgi:hypothetical protein